MMVLALFRSTRKKEVERRMTTFSEQLANAFGQIKNDLHAINNRLDSSQSELSRLSQWVDYLHRHAQYMSESNSRISQKYDKLAENHQKLHTSHKELISSHSRIANLAENLENRHNNLSGTISANRAELKNEIKGEIHDSLKQHKESSEQELARLKAWVDYLTTYVERHKGKEDHLKQDIQRIEKGWSESYLKLRELLNGLKTENTELKSSFSGIRSELDFAKNELKQAKSELDGTKRELSGTKVVLENTNKELENTKNLAKSHIETAKSEVSAPIQQVSQPIPQPILQPQPIIQQVSVPASSFQKHIMARVLPNRKGYVLKFILDLISENKYSTKEIEEIVVNEKQLCGRTSFYAYIKELKLKGRISYAELDERTILVNTGPQQRLQQ